MLEIAGQVTSLDHLDGLKIELHELEYEDLRKALLQTKGFGVLHDYWKAITTPEFFLTQVTEITREELEKRRN
jgi:hypothetical protein